MAGETQRTQARRDPLNQWPTSAPYLLYMEDKGIFKIFVLLFLKFHKLHNIYKMPEFALSYMLLKLIINRV
jgi:hypothetical protein